MKKVTIKKDFNNGKYEVFEGKKKVGTFIMMYQAEAYKLNRELKMEIAEQKAGVL